MADSSLLVDDIIALSWFWLSGQLGQKSFLSFFDWCNDHIVWLQNI
jgi:hypothetical protein